MSSEHSDINVRAVLGFGVGLTAVAAVVYVAIWLLFAFFTSRVASDVPRYPMALEQRDRVPPEPRLQTEPRDDMKALRSRQEAELSSYQWIDRDAGIARLPIAEAMRITLERGLPVRPASEAAR